MSSRDMILVERVKGVLLSARNRQQNKIGIYNQYKSSI